MIDQVLIDRATELLKETAYPKKIILFGSYARNEAREESDLDILVIETEVKDRIGEMIRLTRMLSPLRIPVDLLVVSEEMLTPYLYSPPFPVVSLQRLEQEFLATFSSKKHK